MIFLEAYCSKPYPVLAVHTGYIEIAQVCIQGRLTICKAIKQNLVSF